MLWQHEMNIVSKGIRFSRTQVTILNFEINSNFTSIVFKSLNRIFETTANFTLNRIAIQRGFRRFDLNLFTLLSCLRYLSNVTQRNFI